MESAGEFWTFIALFVAAGGVYMLGANGAINEIMKRLRRKT